MVNRDLLTYAGNLENLQEVKVNERYTFVQGDICNRALVHDLFQKYDFRGVIHFAAESHVDNSIKNPGVFIETNVNGTFVLVDEAYKSWMEKPFLYKKGYEGCRFHHISTDEVYGTLGETGLFTETTPYAPNSPYSASKAGSDMIVRSYHHTYVLIPSSPTAPITTAPNSTMRSDPHRDSKGALWREYSNLWRW